VQISSFGPAQPVTKQWWNARAMPILLIGELTRKAFGFHSTGIKDFNFLPN